MYVEIKTIEKDKIIFLSIDFVELNKFKVSKCLEYNKQSIIVIRVTYSFDYHSLMAVNILEII